MVLPLRMDPGTRGTLPQNQDGGEPDVSKIVMTAMVAAGLVALAAPAGAAIIIQPGLSSVHPDEKLLFDMDGLTRTGMIVQGVTDLSGQIFSIEGQEILTTLGTGPAHVDAQDGGLRYARFYALDPGVFFDSFEANLFFAPGATGTVRAHDNMGGSEELTFALGPGQNFFGILVLDTRLLTQIVISSTSDITDIRHIRVGGVTARQTESQEVPEPGMLLLFGSAAVLGALRRRRQSRTRLL